ncbi:hypothetical protein IMG5_169450 [Ichthyophthirius multifiliis]|uniref:Tr-type G domain-containing protein n=1 Tax=Ichthyophthirius multifiliis TaxID=5932 RepID=G0R1B5_ICHMU|nr:hypothetical protein IMG5_169450 [Ichthyophthirius multifiliis]EGR28748.1 hypothetical protein IMG5_169450 [Ichthyophthirius multifiliis]|eukprot:XP_004029984.1 hypothetical protein IMG5_169450 [Ichthyophthirius multifiliis]
MSPLKFSQSSDFCKKNNCRCPIVSILGHVDTGKTKLLDKLRNTNVQLGEAGGITQQIGATYFPKENIIQQIEKCVEFYPLKEQEINNLLIIDTPGHECFENLRKRGSKMCDLAILVVDLMHGLEAQTIEYKCYGWNKKEFRSSFFALKNQQKNTINDFNQRFQEIVTQFQQQEINVTLFWDESLNRKEFVQVIPTSAISGEGIPDLLSVVLKQYQILQNYQDEDEFFSCVVMEVKKVEGLGFTVDAILKKGSIKKDDKIALVGFNGIIKTKVKAILTPHPMKEMRIKGQYIKHQQIEGSIGIKIYAPDLEKAIAGSELHIINCQEDEDYAMTMLKDNHLELKKIQLQEQGVVVLASSLGSLEALCEFLQSQKIPISYTSVGSVCKECVSIALKQGIVGQKEFACILAFDVKVLPDAAKYAEENHIKVFTAKIIYQLFDSFKKYQEECILIRKKEEGKLAVFPCIFKPNNILCNSSPFLINGEVKQGVIKVGTQLCTYNQEKIKVGIVENIEVNKKSVKEARKENGYITIRIKGSDNFSTNCKLVSILSRESIDALKEFYRNDVSKSEWVLIKDKLKPFFNIV